MSNFFTYNCLAPILIAGGILSLAISWFDWKRCYINRLIPNDHWKSWVILGMFIGGLCSTTGLLILLGIIKPPILLP